MHISICMYTVYIIYIYIYIYELKNEPIRSRKKTQLFSYYFIFLLSSKLLDLHPWSRINITQTNKITSLQISLFNITFKGQFPYI